MSEPLITKYRPKTFAEVIGQPAIVKSLKEICKKRDSQVFLFTGPAGCGKTSLARLVAKAYGVEDTQSAIVEIDAATFTGIDSMRAIQETLRYRPFGGSGQRAIILDEAHSLSKQAFDSLLKTLEEPPAHVVWFFCTTNPAKIPKTLQTRCSKFELKLVDDKSLLDLCDFVCDEEKINTTDEIVDLFVKEAKGCPRQLLSNIVVARTAKTKKEAAELLRAAIESDASLELCQFVANGSGSWTKCMGLLNKLEGESPESLRILIANYLGACLKNAKSDQAAVVFMTRLDGFSQPYVGTDGMAPLLLSIGRALFSE
jgi:DNA polymerase III gamma/tau subunit